MEQLILAEFRKIEAQEKVEGNSFLGGMANYNRNNPDSKISDEDVVGNIILFIFAAYDTSRNSTGWGLHFLGQDQVGQKDLLEEAYAQGVLKRSSDGQQYFNYISSLENIDSCPELEAQFKETLRMGAPFTTTEIR